MSDSLHTWYSLRDLDGLAEREAVLDGEIRLEKLERLRGMLGEDRGSVRAELRVRRLSGGLLTLRLEYRAALSLVCQRCLEPMLHDADGRVELLIFEDSSSDPSVPASCEPLILDGGRLMPAQVIEDELIVSLPLVPRHADAADCGGVIGQYVDVFVDNSVTRKGRSERPSENESLRENS